MIKDKTIEHLEPSAVRLSITVDQESAQNEYRALLGTYMKKSHLKGFRPGKAPEKLLEKKFGDSLRMETAQKLIEFALKTVFEEIDEKPLGHEYPSLEGDLDFDPASDFSFTVRYDVFPVFEVKTYKGLTIEEPQVKIEKEDLQRELEALREQNAITVEKIDAEVEKNHIVTVDFAEIDESGAEIPQTRREDFAFTVGSGYNVYKIDDDILGMKTGEQRIVEKTYDDGEFAGRNIRLNITVKKIKVKELPELDDELAQDIDEAYETLDDLKKSIQTRLEETAASQIRQRKVNALIDALVEKNPITLPESMIRSELHNSWHRLLQQFGGNEIFALELLDNQNSSKDKLMGEWRPGIEKKLKGQLIIQKLVEQEEVDCSPEELEKEIADQGAASGLSPENTREYFEKNRLLDYVKHEVMERKLLDKLFEMNSVKKGPKLKFLDLVGRNG